MPQTSADTRRKNSPHADTNSDLSNITEGIDEQLTVKNRVFANLTLKSKISAVRLSNSNLMIQRIRVDSRKRVQKGKLVEVGSGYFMAVFGKILKRHKRAAMQSIRDIIYQRVKVLALLSFTIDMAKDKSNKHFKIFIENLKNFSCCNSRRSDLFSFKTESGNTPKFQLSNYRSKKPHLQLRIEEGLFMLNDAIEKKLKYGAIRIIKSSNTCSPTKRHKPFNRSSLCNNPMRSSQLTRLSNKYPTSFCNAGPLFSLTHLLFRNKIARYFHVLCHEVRLTQDTSNKIYKRRYSKIQKKQLKLGIDLLYTLYAVAKRVNQRQALNAISAHKPELEIKIDRIVYGKVRQLRNSQTPRKNLIDSQYQFTEVNTSIINPCSATNKSYVTANKSVFKSMLFPGMITRAKHTVIQKTEHTAALALVIS